MLCKKLFAYYIHAFMDHVLTKTKLVFFPLLVLAAAFITVYCFLYWLLWIKLDVIPLREDIVHIWIPIALACLCIFLFIRPRVHLLKLDKNNGKIRTLYYMVGAAVFCVPTFILVDFLDSSTGKLTPLDTITAIKQKPVTKYYKPSTFVLHKSFIGVEPVMSYSGKHNQHLNFDIYIALPFTGDLYDTLQSPAAFLMVQYHRQISSKVSDAERKAQWADFWDESFEKFDKEP
jgi:rhomboid protease GluP